MLRISCRHGAAEAAVFSILHSLVAMSWLLACSSWVARQRRRVDELLDDLLHREVRDEPLGLKAPKDLELVTEAASERAGTARKCISIVAAVTADPAPSLQPIPVHSAASDPWQSRLRCRLSQ